MVARNQFIKVILGKKTCQVESVERVKKFVASHYLKRRGRKPVVDRVVNDAKAVYSMDAKCNTEEPP